MRHSPASGWRRTASAASPRGTLACIRERLGVNVLLHSYRNEDDGVAGTESAFGICSFWSVEARALQGEVAEACAEFEHLLSFGNDVGLFAEEIDVRNGSAVGNFPQAFTHVGLINAAVTIARMQEDATASRETTRSARGDL